VAEAGAGGDGVGLVRLDECRRRTLLLSALAQGITSVAPNRLLAASPIALPTGSANRRFAVFYQGDRIGTHIVGSTPAIASTRVDTEVDMTVKRFIFTVFSYRHRSQETWQGGRLMALSSVTTEDDETMRIDGAAIPRGFRVVGQAGPFIASAATLTSNCLWSSLILRQETVIDAQYGGVIGLSVHKLADQQIVVAGRPVAVTRFRLVTPDVAGTMWYDGAGSWVGGELERRGAKLEYRLEP
jgi:hypothetical protein